MTALIGGLCVGALWGIWATRQLLKRRREILTGMERKRLIMLKLEVLRKQQNYGKQTTETDATTAGTGTGTTTRSAADSGSEAYEDDAEAGRNTD
jgi:hypothetical protein